MLVSLSLLQHIGMVKLFVKIHKVLGMLLSILFCVWFLSGMVLVFVGFPHYSQTEAFRSLAAVDSSAARSLLFPAELGKGTITLEMQEGRAVYRVGKMARTAKTYYADSLTKVAKPTRKDCIAAAQRVVSADTARVTKISKLDIWLPWEQYQSSLPIYKVYFADKDRSVVYVAAKSGTIVQLTTRSERFWALVGAIPHYILFKYLSINHPFWNSLLLALLVLGAVMCLSGVVVGIVGMRRGSRGFSSPYTKAWIRWHHVVGFYFGIFTLTFCLSAYISVAGVPSWIAKSDESVDYQKEWNQPKVKRDAYRQSFPALQELLASRGDVKRVVFASSLGKPCYQLFSRGTYEPEVFLIKGDSVAPLEGYKVADVVGYAKKVFGYVPQRRELLQKFDSYYQLTRMGARPLPVLKMELTDANRSWVYVSTQTGELVTVYDASRRAERWLYRALHTFNIQWLKEHEWLRKTLLLLVCLSGLVVSVSGAVLTSKWVKRKVERYM